MNKENVEIINELTTINPKNEVSSCLWHLNELTLFKLIICENVIQTVLFQDFSNIRLIE